MEFTLYHWCINYNIKQILLIYEQADSHGRNAKDCKGNEGCLQGGAISESAGPEARTR